MTKCISREDFHKEVREMYACILDELLRSVEIHGLTRSFHEGYAVLLEEVDEFWEEVRKKADQRDLVNTRKELIQIASCAMKIALSLT